jgi:hypothetical protein
MTVPTGGKPEDRARTKIDRLLTDAGWVIQNRDSINIEAGRGVAIREFQLAPGHGFADYLLYIDGYAAALNAARPWATIELEATSRGMELSDHSDQLVVVDAEDSNRLWVSHSVSAFWFRVC